MHRLTEWMGLALMGNLCIRPSTPPSALRLPVGGIGLEGSDADDAFLSKRAEVKN